MAAQAPAGEGPAPARPSRIRVLRPEVEEVLKSPRRARPKLLSPQHKEGAGEEYEGGARPRYDCAFQDEGKVGEQGFAAPDMVWCKVRSHPWWPAQVFDAADASELALQHATKPGAPLVAYFWDRTFAWSDPSALRPFRAHFPRLAGQSTLSSFAASVDAALQEVTHRIEAGFSCACSPPTVARKQEIQNSGIREGAYGAVVDDAYTRDTFRAKPFLDYISALGRSPLAGADRLDLTIAKAQLGSFNRSRGTMELPEFVIYQGIEDGSAVAAEVAATPALTKRKRTEKGGGDGDAPAKEKRSRRGESSSRKRDAAKEQEDAIDEDSPMPWKSSAKNRIIDTSMDSYKREAPAKKDATVEGSSKQRKSKRVSKSAVEKKKKHTSKDAADKGKSLPEAEPAKEDDVGEDSSMPSVEAADDTLSKGRKSKISRSQAKAKKNDTSKDADKAESLPEPAKEGAENEDSSMPNADATDDTVSKRRKSKNSTRSAKTKKKDADKKEALPEPAIKEATGDDSSTPSREKKSSKSSAKTKKKDADKKVALPEPAIEEATGDDNSTPSRQKKSSKSSVKKKKAQDTSKDADGTETADKMAVDGILSESKSGRRLRSSHKMEEALEGKKDAGETTKGKGKDADFPKENNLGRRAGSARHKDKITITEDGDGLADVSVKDLVSTGKKKLQLGVHSVTENASYVISEHGRKKKTLVELMAETATPNHSAGGKSKARTKPPLPSTLKPEDPDLDKKATPKTRGNRSLPASTEKPEDPDTDKKATPKTREKRSLPASIEKPKRDTRSAMKTREKRSLPASTEEPEDPDRGKNDTMKTRGKRSLPASTEKPEDPDCDTKGTAKTKGKRSLPEPTEEPEYPDDRDMKDTMHTRKRKKLDNLGDLSSQPQPLSPKGSTKAREVKRKAAGQKSQASPVVKANGGTSGDSSSQPEPLSPKRSARRKSADLKQQTPLVVKANGEASQMRSRRAKNSEATVPDKPPRSVKLDKGKKGAALAEDSPSCGEMLSQLCIGASDLKKIGKITPTSASFLTDFLKSARACTSDVEKAANMDASSPNADEEIPEKATEKVSSPHVDEEIPEKATDNVSSHHADEEIPEKAADKVSSPHADEVIPEEVVEKVSSPHADEVIPEEAVEKVATPHADEEVPEEAAEKVSSPNADEVPEEAADKVSSLHADEAIPEKAAEKVSSPNADEVKLEEAAEEVSNLHADEAIPEKAADEVSSAPADEDTLENEIEKVSSPYADEVKLEEEAGKVSSPHADDEIPEKAAEKVSSPHADEAIPEKAADEVSSPPADVETPEKAAEKVYSPLTDEEIAEKAADEVSSPRADVETPEKAAEEAPSPHADEEIAENAANKVSSPRADEEMAEKAAEEVPGPHAEEEMAEKAAEEVPGPHVDEEMAEKATEEVPIPDAVEEMVEKATNSEPAPSEPPVADHMKDDYWADIHINVEEPISSLLKKGKGKMRSSKKQRHADDAAGKESPVTVVSVEEPKAERQQVNTDENGKAEEEVTNGGGQANAAAEEVENNTSLTGLVMHFSKPGAVPSRSDLIKIFSQYGPVSEARTETDENVSSAQVVFRRRMDAEAAFGGAGKIAALGPGLASFRLTDFPCAEAAAAAFWGDGPRQE